MSTCSFVDILRAAEGGVNTVCLLWCMGKPPKELIEKASFV